LQDVKLRDVKLTDRVAGHEIAGVKMTDQITRHEIGGHIIAGRKNRNAVFRCYFLNTQHYQAPCVNDCLLKSGNTNCLPHQRHAAFELIIVQCAGSRRSSSSVNAAIKLSCACSETAASFWFEFD